MWAENEKIMIFRPHYMWAENNNNKLQIWFICWWLQEIQEFEKAANAEISKNLHRHDIELEGSGFGGEDESTGTNVTPQEEKPDTKDVEPEANKDAVETEKKEEVQEETEEPPKEEPKQEQEAEDEKEKTEEAQQGKRRPSTPLQIYSAKALEENKHSG